MATSGDTRDTRSLLKRIYNFPLPAYRKLVELIREALRRETALEVSFYEKGERGTALNIVWNAPAGRLQTMPPATLVAAIELAGAQAALTLLRSYVGARLRPSQIVVAGNLRQISEDDYYQLLDTGALLYHVDAGENVRETTERALRPLYESLTGMAQATPAATNPLTHRAAPATMSADELNAWLRNYSSNPDLD